jgi:hypothetical protein
MNGEIAERGRECDGGWREGWVGGGGRRDASSRSDRHLRARSRELGEKEESRSSPRNSHLQLCPSGR